MQLLRQKCENELGTQEQRGEFYDFREREIWLFPKQDGKHRWAQVAACLLQVFLLVFIKFFIGGQRRMQKINFLTAHLSWLTKYIFNCIYTSVCLSISISPKVDRCILVDRDCLYKGNTSFGHWSVIWPWQDVVILHDCWIAVVTIVLSCVIYQQDTGIPDETETKLLYPVQHN